MDRRQRILAALQPFPMLSTCFSGYLSCVMDRCPDPSSHNMVWAIEEAVPDWMKRLETRLQASQALLGIESSQEYATTFRFERELCPRSPALPDQRKIEDILSEALLPLDFNALGFVHIKRITPSQQVGKNRIPEADFVAELGGNRTAIEVKTIRIESWASSGDWLGPSVIPYWWGHLFLNDMTRKLSQDDRRALSQLENTCQRLHCTRKLLAVCIQRISVTSLMTEDNYRSELAKINADFPELDYICVKENAHGRLICFPDLPAQNG